VSRAALLALLLLAAACGGLAGRTTSADAPPGVPADAQPATVSRHVDGDTLWVAVDEPGGVIEPGEDHRVRLLQVDTPEVTGSPVGEECFGPEAADFTAAQAPLGARVWLEHDRRLTDRFDRHLRHVWLDDGTLLNERIVAEGYGVALLVEPNDARIRQLRAAEDGARRAGRGLWSACELTGR
jgi:micrococcal nuclease